MSDEAQATSMEMPEFCWTEIAGTDLSKCKEFYTNVFGWQFEKSKATGEEFEYLEFSSGGDDNPDGALYEMQPEMFGGPDAELPPAHIAVYVSVYDVDATIAKAVEIGGTILFGPYDIPNVGRMAIINDPTGAAISVITLKPH